MKEKIRFFQSVSVARALHEGALSSGGGGRLASFCIRSVVVGSGPRLSVVSLCIQTASARRLVASWARSFFTDGCSQRNYRLTD